MKDNGYTKGKQADFSYIFNWTSVLKWGVLVCAPYNGHQKDFMCLQEIGLRSQSVWTITDGAI